MATTGNGLRLRPVFPENFAHMSLLMDSDHPPTSVAVIGAGPAGLMAAEVLSQAGLEVHVHDAMPSPGRKFLLAGRGGLNITHSEALEVFLTRYGERQQQLNACLRAFGPDALRAWVHDLGVQTFVGSSGRVFPDGMKAAPLLRSWLHRLRNNGVQLHVRHRWQGLAADAGGWRLSFATPEGSREERYASVILATGGGSWAKLGSDGAWVATLQAAGIPVAPLLPSNCGFDTHWSAHFSERFAGEALKNVAASVDKAVTPLRRGECMVSASGLEGGLIYALSNALRQALITSGSATLLLDLMPDRSHEWLRNQIAQPRGARSMASHLQNRLGLKGVKASLLRECTDAATYANPQALAAAIKALPIRFHAMRPIDEAISTAGGVLFEAVDDALMLQTMPGVFCAGEMLDWDAPTGGYLLTACMATGRAAGQGAICWLRANQMPGIVA